jgi:NADH:ubiquinone oxidoreductase subunit 3 (subunit A)
MVDGRRRIWTFAESVIAFLTVLLASTVIYALGRLKAPKPPARREKVSLYACGEKVRSARLSINVTPYKYLVYFIILDASTLMIAFASLSTSSATVLPLMIYLSTILAATIILALGGD